MITAADMKQILDEVDKEYRRTDDCDTITHEINDEMHTFVSDFNAWKGTIDSKMRLIIAVLSFVGTELAGIFVVMVKYFMHI